MKFPVFLYILVLGTACAPQGLPVMEPSPARASAQPASPSSPVPPTLPLPSPTPIFEGVTNNVATGQQGQLYASGFGSDDLQHLAQWDGAKWIELGNGFKTAGNSLAVDGAGQLYTEMLRDSNSMQCTAIMRWNGARWEDITDNFSIAVDTLKAGRIPCNVPVIALAVDGEDNLYAAGSFSYPNADLTAELPMGYVAKWDKETWTVLGRGFNQVNIFAMAVSATGIVYAAGEQPRIPAKEYSVAGFIAQWDGKEWTQIGTRKLSSCLNIMKIALDGAGGLYASCRWDKPGELIFHWDGIDWTTITSQLEGDAPAVYDMAVDRNGYLYIAGSFEAVSGLPARYIACWDGSSWHALGDGVNERVNALAFDPGGELYAVGFLSEAAGLPVQHAARWDGKTWHALLPGVQRWR